MFRIAIIIGFLLLISPDTYAQGWEIIRVANRNTIELKNECFPKELQLTIKTASHAPTVVFGSSKCAGKTVWSTSPFNTNRHSVGLNRQAGYQIDNWDRKVPARVELDTSTSPVSEALLGNFLPDVNARGKTNLSLYNVVVKGNSTCRDGVRFNTSVNLTITFLF